MKTRIIHKITTFGRIVFGVFLIVLIWTLFVRDFLVAKKDENKLRVIHSDSVVSIDVGEYARGLFDQSGNPSGNVNIISTTNRGDIEAFVNLLHNLAPSRWNHDMVIDYYYFTINSKDGAINLQGRQLTANPNGIWLQFSGLDGAFVSNLYSWITNAPQLHKTNATPNL